MSSTQEGSSEAFRGRKKKKNNGEKQTRRSWSSQEELVLISSLKELVAHGWKCDNGFRGGYIQRLEEAMLKEFPGSDIQAFPHITSKLQIWKKNYGSLTMMLSRSGVGFNGKHEIDCTPELWAEICKCDKNARSMKNKSWPLFEDWKELFGKDRATGEGAEDFMDAVNEMTQEKNLGQENTEDGTETSYNPNVDEISVNDVGENSSCHSEKDAPVNKSSGKGKKRKVVDDVSRVAEIFLQISQGTHSRLDTIASRVGYKYDQDQAKKDAFMLLENIAELSLVDKFRVSDIFIDKPDRLTFFKGLPDADKPPYVQYLLNSKPT